MHACHRVFLREKRFFSNSTVSRQLQRAWLFFFVSFSFSLSFSLLLCHIHTLRTQALHSFTPFSPVPPPRRPPIYISAYPSICSSIYLRIYLSVGFSAIYLSVSPGGTYQDPPLLGGQKEKWCTFDTKKLGGR